MSRREAVVSKTYAKDVAGIARCTDARKGDKGVTKAEERHKDDEKRDNVLCNCVVRENVEVSKRDEYWKVARESELKRTA